MKKIGRYRAAFVPWTVQAEYSESGDFVPNMEPDEEGELSEYEYQQLYNLTDGQMLWRRSKIHELGSLGKFRQEYPIDVTEAFAAADIEGVFIKPAYVLKARKRRDGEIPDAPLIIGVDPGRQRRRPICRRIPARRQVFSVSTCGTSSSTMKRWRGFLRSLTNGSRTACASTAVAWARILSLRCATLNKRYFDVVKGVDFGGKSKAKLANPEARRPVEYSRRDLRQAARISDRWRLDPRRRRPGNRYERAENQIPGQQRLAAGKQDGNEGAWAPF
jgi:hypothetical protein